MKKTVLTLVFSLSLSVIALGQIEYIPHFTASVNSYSSTSGALPFWLTHNKSGIYDNDHPTYLLADIAIGKGYNKKDKWVDVGYGIEFYGAYADSFNFRFQQFFIDLKINRFNLAIGAKSDSVISNGLSSTNKSWLISNNARPNTSISLGTIGFVPFLENYHEFQLSCRYEEGLLLDNRYISKPRMHRKDLFFRYGYPEDFMITIGAEHAVIWGGDLKEYGKLSNGFSDYFKSILGLNNTSIIEEGEVNRNGFHLGNWSVDVQAEINDIECNAYLIHPLSRQLDRGSNIIGVSANFQAYTEIVQMALIELHRIKGEKDGMLLLGYNSDDTYRTGYTFFEQLIGDPLLGNLEFSKQNELNLDSDQYYAIHAGFKGNIKNYFRWKGMLTYSKHLGLINNPFDNAKNQLSWYAELTYYFAPGKMNISIDLAGDRGQLLSNALGGGFRLTWFLN